MSVFTEKLDFLTSWSIDYVDCSHVVIVPLPINLNLNQNPLYLYFETVQRISLNQRLTRIGIDNHRFIYHHCAVGEHAYRTLYGQ